MTPCERCGHTPAEPHPPDVEKQLERLMIAVAGAIDELQRARIAAPTLYAGVQNAVAEIRSLQAQVIELKRNVRRSH